MRDLLLNHFSTQRLAYLNPRFQQHKTESENDAIIHKSSVLFTSEFLMRARSRIVWKVNINSFSTLRPRELLARRCKWLEFDQFPFTTRHSNLFFFSAFRFDLIWWNCGRKRTKTKNFSVFSLTRDRSLERRQRATNHIISAFMDTGWVWVSSTFIFTLRSARWIDTDAKPNWLLFCL